MRFSKLPENSHRQRLATPGIAKALRRLFLSVSRAKDRGRARRRRADELIHGSAEHRPTDTYSASKNSLRCAGATLRVERAFVFSARPGALRANAAIFISLRKRRTINQ